MNERAILVSGASGFIGRRLVLSLKTDGFPVVQLSRSSLDEPGAIRADLGDVEALRRACENVWAVFHCAGYAHAQSDADEQGLHQDVNFQGTKNLVEAAGRAGVECFVFMSSVKAMGLPGHVCADEAWSAPPDTEYGRAKRAAEESVLSAGQRYGMRCTNLRLAMVYGRGGRGNLDRMARAIRRGWFPPLPETGARRSLVHVDDVVAAARLVGGDARAAGETFIVADSHAYSGREIYDALRDVLGLGRCSWQCPVGLLRMAGALGDLMQRVTCRRLPINRKVVERLIDAECYSPARIERELGWRAKVSLREGLEEAFAGAGGRDA